MNSIKRQRELIDTQLTFWYEQEKYLQQKCKHKNVEKKHCGSTGNYDPSCDSYWIEFKCPDCKKFWTEHQ